MSYDFTATLQNNKATREALETLVDAVSREVPFGSLNRAQQNFIDDTIKDDTMNALLDILDIERRAAIEFSESEILCPVNEW